MKTKNYQPIQDYAIVGNCKTTALVHKEGSIDLFCFPRFDSPSVFAKLMDTNKGGSFHCKPNFEPVRKIQRYLHDSNILLTQLFSENQSVEFIDFMPVNDDFDMDNQLIRIVKMVRGKAEFNLTIDIAPDYARHKAHIIKNSNYSLTTSIHSETEEQFGVCSNDPLFDDKDELISTFQMKEGDVRCFVLGQTKDLKSESADYLQNYASDCLDQTLKFWQIWIKQCNYSGKFDVNVRRSALILKLLTSHEFGSTVAAPTFSLPEKIGGDRNYDYRYTWIRDAAFTMFAFMKLGFYQESCQFMNWIQKQIETDTSEDVKLQIMYKIDGDRDLEEKEINLEGYKKSKPVLIGNAATEQIQLDVFGELMDTIYLFDKHGEPISYSFWKSLEKLLEFVCKNWNQPDHGIWEVRETKRHYLYTRVMCWVALDRAVKLVRKRSFPTDLEKWIENKNLIYDDIQNNFWNEDLQSFVHFKGAKTVDCAMLAMPLVHAISPSDEKWKSTMALIKKQLVSDVLVFRNMHDDLPKEGEHEEGTFMIGAFWYAECLARGGKLKQATHHLEKLLSYGNHVNLFSEEMSLSGMHLGNFPQAFTHLSIISAAHTITKNETSDKKLYNDDYRIV